MIFPLNDNIFIQELEQKDRKTEFGLILSPDSGLPISGVGEVKFINKKTSGKILDEFGEVVLIGSIVFFSQFSSEEVKYYEKETDGQCMPRLKKIHYKSLAGVRKKGEAPVVNSDIFDALK